MGAFALALLGSYLLGSFPTAFVFVKRLKGIDVRTVGSGNVGATNVTRVAGWAAGLLVFLIDLAKGLAAVVVIAPLLIQPLSPTQQLSCGLASTVGHGYPVWLGFRGGKGVATTIGVLLGAMPVVAIVFLLVWVLCYRLWRYVSVGSMAAAASIPITQVLQHQSRPEVLLGLTLALLLITKHHANIRRLLKGQEHRAGRPPPFPEPGTDPTPDDV